jgi:hypothetical protein
MNLQQKPFVSIAQPDLASKGVIKMLRLASDGLSAEQWHRRSIGFQRNPKVEFLGCAERKISDVVSRRMTALTERSLSHYWYFSKRPEGRRQLNGSADISKREAARDDDNGVRRTPAPIVASVMTAPTASTSTPSRPIGKDDPPPTGGTTPMIEIVMGAATIRVPPGADLPTLQAVLHAVRSLP